MKYEDWIKYEEERLKKKELHKTKSKIKINGRPLSSLTLDEMLTLMRAWVAAQPPRLHPHLNEVSGRTNSTSTLAV